MKCCQLSRALATGCTGTALISLADAWHRFNEALTGSMVPAKCMAVLRNFAIGTLARPSTANIAVTHRRPHYPAPHSVLSGLVIDLT